MKNKQHLLRLLGSFLISAMFFLWSAGTLSAQNSYEKITSLEDLTEGIYLIVYDGGSSAYAASCITETKKYMEPAAVSVENNTISVAAASTQQGTEPHEFLLTRNGSDWTIKDIAAGQYITNTSTANGSIAYSDEAFNWSISYSNNLFLITSELSATCRLQYNSNSGQERFTNYKTATQKDLSLYKKVSPCAPVEEVRTNPSTTSARLTWDVPATHPASYTLTITGPDAEQIVNEEAYTHTDYTCEGLTPATQYSYSLTANCSASFQSDAITGTFTTTSDSDPSLSVTAPEKDHHFENEPAAFTCAITHFELDAEHLIEASVSRNLESGDELFKTVYSQELQFSVDLPTGSYTATFYLVNVDGNDTTRVANVHAYRDFSVTMPGIEFANKTLEIKGFKTVASSALTVLKGILLSDNATASLNCPQGNFSVEPATLTYDQLMEGAEITVTYNGAELEEEVEIEATCGELSDRLTVKVVNETLNEVATLAELRAGTENEYYKVTGQVVVSAEYVNGTNANIWVQDATGGILVYGSNDLLSRTYATGDALTGIYGKLTNYNNLLELVIAGDLPEADAHEQMPEPEVVNISDLSIDNLDEYCSRLVRINGLTLTETEGAWANGTVYAVNPDSETDTLVIYTTIRGDFIGENKPTGLFDLIALVGVYKETVQVFPRSKADIIPLRASVAMPAFDLDPEITYETAQFLTITCPTEGARIYYTTDGSTPTGESREYTEPIEIKKTTTVKAVAMKDDLDNSPVASIVVKIAVSVQGEVVFHEFFDHIVANINQEMKVEETLPDWSGTKVYPADQCLRVATTNAAGSITLPALDLSYDEGNYFVIFRARAWYGDKTEIHLTANGQTVTVAELNNTIANDVYTSEGMSEYIFAFDNGSEATEITFSTINTTKNRFFLDSILIYQVLPDEPMLIFTKTTTISTLQSFAASHKTTIRGKKLEEDVTVNCPEGNFSVNTDSFDKDEVMSDEGVELTVTYNGAALEDSVKIELTSGELTEILTVYAHADALTTVATLSELRAGNQDGYYRVSGEVVLTAKDQTYNYKWIEDDEAGMLIYDPQGLVTTTYEIGDGIEGVIGKLSNYGGQLQLEMIGNLPEASSHNNTIEPQEVTISELEADIEKYCSRLIRIKKLSLVETEGQWVGNTDNMATDADGNTVNIRTFVRNGSFVGEDKPQTAFDLVALAGVFNDGIQVSPRFKEDITANTANQTENRLHAELYPNPTGGTVYVELESNARMDIFTVTGSLIRTAELQAGKNEIRINQSGIYFIRLSNTTGITVKRIVVR
ncbi:MAG: chitobiase/beta-hexosaminidase C-terminal domain-containing protein [Bacteroidales bacterium]|nr:chitobiase/beta-hexosaminidase C-terminal domain-containing protein [Bacteroidales bacterium]